MMKQIEQSEIDLESMVCASDREGDPVHSNSQGWWFYDETWSFAHGPYGSEDETRSALHAYAQTL